MKGVIADIQRYSIHDGPGIRTTVFLKGCNLYCPWCHNPETQSQLQEEMFFQDSCVGCGHCAEGCPTGARKQSGTFMEHGELLTLLERDRPFYGSDGGVTFSGGEPLLQAEFVAKTAALCQDAGIPACVQTALCVSREALLPTIPYTDIYLADVKVLNKWREYTGGDPALLTENLSILRERQKRVWLRIPAIRDVNDTPHELEAIAGLLMEFCFAERVETLPLYGHAAQKYRALNRKQSDQWFAKEPDRIAMNMAEQLTYMTGIRVMAVK